MKQKRHTLPGINRVFLYTSLLLFSFGCEQKENDQNANSTKTSEKKTIDFFGNTQGTTYAVICNDKIEISLIEIENLLKDFDNALSTYQDNSVISNFNKFQGKEFAYNESLGYFNRCYLLAEKINELTNGSFEPTLFPIINAWGFYKKEHTKLDTTKVDSLMNFVGFDEKHLQLKEILDSTENYVPANIIIKKNPKTKLDFNGIAQGLAVDIISELLIDKGAQNFYVEIGGEIRVAGLNREGKSWRIGIDKPITGSDEITREIQAIVELSDYSIATSGSYRNFFLNDGKEYSHTIDPKTGFPIKNGMISATVVAKSCAEADALATACLVMGPEKAMNFFKADTVFNGHAFLIYKNDKGRTETAMSPHFSSFLQ